MTKTREASSRILNPPDPIGDLSFHLETFSTPNPAGTSKAVLTGKSESGFVSEEEIYYTFDEAISLSPHEIIVRMGRKISEAAKKIEARYNLEKVTKDLE